ncbi:MAG: hypothetical protein IPI81_16155 [Flavobacteriales bacterium]|nr:hypothetical protein [Flavobacteriales bacterium]
MTRVRLEIDSIQIHRPKERWHLYFVVMTEHPTDPDKMIVATLPTTPFKLTPRHENKYSFDGDGTQGAEGLKVFTKEMPDIRELNCHIYLRHSRRATRDLGAILADLKTGLGGDAIGLVENIVGTTTPWLVIAKSAVSLVGKTLEKIPDRDLGFVSAFERFGPEFELQTDIDRAKDFTGDASLVYSWSVE